MATPANWYKRRGYLHFDEELGEAAAFALASSPALVAGHAFLPFLKFVSLTRRRKRKPKLRTIQYAAHADAHIYAYYTHLLSDRYEAVLAAEGLGQNVLAYRKVHTGPTRDLNSNIGFANEVFSEVLRRPDCWAVCFDVTGFFDNVRHADLKVRWRELLGGTLPDDHYAVFKSITTYASVERDRLARLLGVSKRLFRGPGQAWTKAERARRQRNAAKTRPRRLCEPADLRRLHTAQPPGQPLIVKNQNSYGIPQGSPISAMLSNVYMLPLDVALAGFAASVGGVYRRYCDDILLIVPPEAHSDAEQRVAAELGQLGLAMSQHKTERVHFAAGEVVYSDPPGNRPLQYLGLTFDGIRTRIRHASIARFEGKRARAIAAAVRAGARRSNGQVCIKPLIRKFTHLGRRNFVAYVRRAWLLTGEKGIARQLGDTVAQVSSADV